MEKNLCEKQKRNVSGTIHKNSTTILTIYIFSKMKTPFEIVDLIRILINSNGKH